ncbi:MAG TPA: efflux RND transporter periplasmic adaptor subunit [Gemmataceae bacterium]
MTNPPMQAVEPPVPEQIASRLRDFQVADHERRGGGRRRKRLLLWMLVVLVLAGGSLAGYSYRNANNVPEADVFVYTGKPSRDVLLDLSGFVVPRTKVVISPQVGGIVSRVVLPEEGKTVKTGDLLFEIDDTRYKAEYLQAEASLATAAAQLDELKNGHEVEEKQHASALLDQARVQEEIATREHERARRLFPGSIGQAEYDRALASYRDAKMAVKVQKAHRDLIHKRTRAEKITAAEAEVQRATAARDRAKYFFDKTKIFAPADSEGHSRVFTILQRNVNPGESIQADLVYTAMCTLADLSEMEAEVDVQERDLRQVTKDAPCEVIPDAYPDHVYKGHLSRMQPLVNRQRGVVQMKVAIDNPDGHLLPDMNARVLFVKEKNSLNGDEDLPRIPVKALAPNSDPPAVFVLDGGVARLRTIQLGAVVGDSVQVREGLQPEEKVLLPTSQPLKDGKPVRPRGQSKDGDAARKDAV